jgi:hypothetical protein
LDVSSHLGRPFVSDIEERLGLRACEPVYPAHQIV